MHYTKYFILFVSCTLVAAERTPKKPYKREQSTALALALDAHAAPEVLEKLIKQGANPKTRGSTGLSPLQKGVNRNNLSLCTTALQYGADVHETMSNNETLAMNALSTHMLLLLLHNGASLTQKDKQGRTALHHHGFNKAITTADTLARLCNKGRLDPNIQDNQGNTCLHSVCRHLDTEKVAALVVLGIDTEKTNKQEKRARDCIKSAASLTDFDNAVTIGTNVKQTLTQERKTVVMSGLKGILNRDCAGLVVDYVTVPWSAYRSAIAAALEKTCPLYRKKNGILLISSSPS